MKRLFDITVSLTGLLLLSPLFLLIIAVLIRLDSKGPVFFIQKRMGRNLRPFNLYKFRSMRVDAPGDGPAITVAGDPRITGVGRYLRKTKLDELPQLINVLKGDMSLVGPRPEVEEYVRRFRKDYEDILRVRPGITDAASLAFRNEEEVLKDKENPEEYYVNILLPEKIRLAREYAAKASLVSDIRLIVMTVAGILYPAHFIEKTIAFSTPYRKFAVMGIQAVIFALSNYLAFSIRFDGNTGPYIGLFFRFLPLLLLIRISIHFIFSMDRGLWKYVSLADVIKLCFSITLGTGVFFVTVRYILGYTSYPLSIYIIDWFLNVFLLCGIRMFRRLNDVYEKKKSSSGTDRRIMVIGAGDAAEMFARHVEKSIYYGYKIIGFIDDDPAKKNLKIRDIPILGTRRELKNIPEFRQVEEFLIAIPSAPEAVIKEIVRDLRQYGLPIKTMPRLCDILNGSNPVGSLKLIEPEDVLFRAPLLYESARLRSFIKGKTVMITGAGGSIGSELSKQVLSYHPASLILLERHEESLFMIDRRLRLSPDSDSVIITPVIGDILDEGRVGRLMAEYQPQIVFHAAAYKHVPLMEDNPYEAFKTNVIGTKIMAEKSGEYGVERFVMISTDKAVNPVNVMGMTKKIAEDVVRAIIKEKGLHNLTSYMIVRFGNVLDSSGSVVPIFREQIKRGGPVTVTHPEIRRYFMTIPEAVNLVLQASSIGNGGEIFVLDMGKPVKILDLAKRMISLYGHKPGIDMDIIFTGLRPGEKLSEELFNADEEIKSTPYEKIMMAVPEEMNWPVSGILRALNHNMIRDRQDVISIYKRLTNGRREHKRFGTELKFSFATDFRNGTASPGTLLDISLSGFSARLTQDFPPGKKIYVNISGDGNGRHRELNSQAEVIWMRRENNYYKYGLKFIHAGGDLSEILADYIEELHGGDSGLYMENGINGFYDEGDTSRGEYWLGSGRG
ncbi:MAG: polysaccharide biosynthesis protein [Deferribacteres bacterium]|nr:polysaccharide biosynthesis protein [Deferribacteres bacterium]